MDNKYKFVECSVLEGCDTIKVEVCSNDETQTETDRIRVKRETGECHDDAAADDWMKPEQDMYETEGLHVEVEVELLEGDPHDPLAVTPKMESTCDNGEWSSVEEPTPGCSSAASGASDSDRSVPSTQPVKAPCVGDEIDDARGVLQTGDQSTIPMQPISSGSHGTPPDGDNSIPSKPNSRKPQITIIRPYVCTFCDAKFAQSSNLKTHVRIHTGERPFECTFCDVKCIKSSDLKKHLHIHSGERPFSCTICDARFVQSSNLKTHMRIHTGERPFGCTFCGAKFVQSINLKRHMNIHTGERPYSCSSCDAKFIKSSDLKRHTQTHNTERPLRCSYCGAKFFKMPDFKRHLRIHTGEALND